MYINARHCVAGLSKVAVDFIDSLSLSVGVVGWNAISACKCVHIDPAYVHLAMILILAFWRLFHDPFQLFDVME